LDKPYFVINSTLSKQPLSSTQVLSQLIVEGMQEKKAIDIAVLDLREVKNAIADYFVICSATSDTQVDAIADSIEDYVRKAIGERCNHKEGKVNREWILLDYLDVVAHVFKQDKRRFFALEDLWGDAAIDYLPNQ
jgi:ribosome-associated protein